METRSANRPPRDITPARFFTDWLPREFGSEFGAGKRAASDITVAVDLEGDSGGRWVLDVRGGNLSVRGEGGAGPAPMVQLWQSVQDWRALAVGEDGANVDLAPPQASALDVLFVDPASRQILTAVKGTVRFEVTGYNARTWGMLVRFGTQPGKVEPDATITVDAATYAAILARKLAPPEAYFSGKISLRGDTSLAMQLAMAMLPRFTQK
ncbi:MAG TPA: SCP2 sterol-binding domain-containing protein [Polyangia bacterium]|nr:SCP2 sterol-binding domain-containing protein [Polyangia bacterium]